MPRTRYACEICGEYFPTADSLRRRCREIIDSYLKPGCGDEEQMTDEHAAFFSDLVWMRDRTRIPQGTHLLRVVRCCRDGQRGRHVRFDYANGYSDMIGWSKMCGGPPATLTVVSNAMRETIRQQVHAAYVAFFDGRDTAVCQRTGVDVSYSGEFCDRAVVHHAGMSFADIRDAWLRQMNISIESIPLKDMWDGGGHVVADGVLCESWKRFHSEVAVLEVVSERWHMSHHARRATAERRA